MRVQLLVLGCLLSICLTAQTSGHLGAPKFAPPDGKKLLIIGQDLGAVGGLSTHNDGYVDNITTHLPAGVTTYTGIGTLDGLATWANWGAGDVHAAAYLSDNTFDNTAIVIGLYMVGSLPSLPGGFLDSKIEELGQWIKDTERPVFLRIGYEFDGPWNNYNPNQYKEAWKYIVHKFDELEVRNVAYVWQSSGINTQNLEDWYPGDKYVNWIGYSHFTGNNIGATTLAFAEAHDKPVMIAESTPRIDLKVGDGASHWLSWYLPLFETIYANDRIKALAYINVDWDAQPMWQGQGWGDSRVQVNPFVKDTWINEIAKDPWCTASDSLFEQMQLDLWQDSIATHTYEIEQDPIELQLDWSGEGLTIQAKGGKPIDGIALFDLMGRQLFTNQKRQTNYLIPGRFLPNGILLLQVRSEQLLHVQKVYVRH